MVYNNVLKNCFVLSWLLKVLNLFSYVDLSEKYIQNINAKCLAFPVFFVFP